MRLAIALFLLSCGWWSNKTPIDMDTAVFPSPDKKEIASFESKDDGSYYLEIKDSKTGHLDGAAKLDLPPVFSLQWTRDDKTILVVSHVAHGSTATLFHLSDGKWSSDIFFPSDFSYEPGASRVLYNVAKAEAEEHNVRLTYELDVGDESDPDENHDKHYLITDVIDPNTNRILTTKRTLVE